MVEWIRAGVHLLVRREVPEPCSELLSKSICSQIHFSKLTADPFSPFLGTAHPSASFLQLNLLQFCPPQIVLSLSKDLRHYPAQHEQRKQTVSLPGYPSQLLPTHPDHIFSLQWVPSAGITSPVRHPVLCESLEFQRFDSSRCCQRLRDRLVRGTTDSEKPNGNSGTQIPNPHLSALLE